MAPCLLFSSFHSVGSLLADLLECSSCGNSTLHHQLERDHAGASLAAKTMQEHAAALIQNGMEALRKRRPAGIAFVRNTEIADREVRMGDAVCDESAAKAGGTVVPHFCGFGHRDHDCGAPTGNLRHICSEVARATRQAAEAQPGT